MFRTAVSVLAVLEQHTAIQIANSKHTEVIHCQCINIGDPTKLHSVTCNKIHFPKQSAFEERRGWKTHLLVYPYRQKPTSPSKHGKDLCKLVGKAVFLTVRGCIEGRCWTLRGIPSMQGLTHISLDTVDFWMDTDIFASLCCLMAVCEKGRTEANLWSPVTGAVSLGGACSRNAVKRLSGSISERVFA